MASIIKRNSTYSVVYYFKESNGVKKQKWETFKTLEDAQKRKENIESGFAFNMKPIHLFRDLVDEFLKCYGKAKWSYSTYYYNISLLNRYILNHLGELPLSTFSTRMLNNYYSTLESQLPVKTVLTINKILKTIFRQAVIWECIEYAFA